MDGSIQPGQVFQPGLPKDEDKSQSQDIPPIEVSTQDTVEPIDTTEVNLPEIATKDSAPEPEPAEPKIPIDDKYAATARNPQFQDELLDRDAELVRWTASEFIEHQKSAGWFFILSCVAFCIAAVVYFLSRDLFGPIIVFVLAIIFGFGAARRPRVLDYAVTSSGIDIGAKHYAYEDFRAFGVVKVGAVESIVLMPAKRWMPSISIYYAPEDSDKIIDALGSFMPMEERAVGLTDKFLHKIRF